MFNQFVQQPIQSGLVFFYHLLGNNLGLAIIGITLAIRLVLLPITLPSLKSAKKIKDLKPELDKLKAIHGKDKQALQAAQLELYKKHNINPASGCLPQIINLIILIGLYRVLIQFLQSGQINGGSVNISFLWMNLGEPDKSYITPLIAGAAQFFMALMLAPATDTSAEKVLASQTKTKKDDEKAEDMTDMASTMQQQMLFIMPIMTTVLALRFPSGVTLYWIITTLFSIVQQYFISGWGGIKHYAKKFLKK